MSDLPEDQLPEEDDAANLPLMGRGTIHAKYKWIADGLAAIQKSQAELARAIGLDQPSMTRQLKGKRALKADELTAIHKFFADNGLNVPQQAGLPNQSLTKLSEDVPTAVEGPRTSLEGKVDITIMLVDELKEAVKDLRGRVQALEQSNRAEIVPDHPKGARRK